jgi:hypothetical protein
MRLANSAASEHVAKMSRMRLMESAIYKFGGLRIASAFPLFGLQVCRNETEAQCDVVIRCASIPEGAASASANFLDGQYSEREVLLDYPAVGRFLLRAGKEIVMDLAASSNDDEVRAYLLGAVFGALCHQRGVTPLHASAIDVADGCVAFVGASGAGKSTLVAALAQRGHEVISDDECFLQLGTSGDAQAWPGISRIWLWDDSMTVLGFDGAGVERELHGYKKYLAPVRSPRNPTQSRPLRRVYQLNRAPNGVAEVTRLRGADAVEVLMQNVYPRSLAHHPDYQSHVFLVCAATARDVPVFRFDRPWNFASFDQGIDLLENHLRDAS